MSVPAGKKGKKKAKAKTVSLNDFLGESSSPGVVKQINWADETDEDFGSVNSSLAYQSTSAPKVIHLPTAPRASRSVEIDHSRIPENGPYTAFVGNLPYEVSQYVLEEFFKGLQIVNVRLPEENGRFKGFGYVQFEDKQSLIKALEMNEEQLQKRNIRIDIADNQTKEGATWGRSGGDRSDRYGSGPDPTEQNWRRASTDDAQPERRNYGYDSGMPRDERTYHSDYDNGNQRRRPYDDRYHDRRHSYRGGSYRNDSFSSDSYRKNSQGYDQPSRGYNDNYRQTNRRYDRQRSDDRGYDRGSSGGGYDRPRYEDRGGYDRPRYDDRGGFDRGSSRREYRQEQAPPRERPQLILKPRQKPLESEEAPARSSSIFGSAKPVDTTAREREIEEKLKEKSQVEVKRPEKKSSDIFGGARPIDTSAREREMEAKIVEREKQIVEKAAAKPPVAQPKSSVFGDAKPVDTTARERQIEEKMRRQEQEYISQSSREDDKPRRYSRQGSERSDDGLVSPRRSRTSSTRSVEVEEIEKSSNQRKPSSEQPRKQEFKPAPMPSHNAWGRKNITPGSNPSDQGAKHVPKEKPQGASQTLGGNAWNRGPPKVDQLRGEREEAEGNSKEDEEEERTPEGAADGEDIIQHRTEPGDGSENGEQRTNNYSSSSRQDSHRKYDGRSGANRDRWGSDGYSGKSNSSAGANKNRRYPDNRRRGDGDSHSYQRDDVMSSRGPYNRGTAGNRSVAGGAKQASSFRNGSNEKRRDSSRDSRPECDRPDTAGQEQAPAAKGTKPRSKAPPQILTEEKVDFVEKSKFALLAIEDSDNDNEDAIDY